MKNPIPHCGLFATPESWDELMTWIEAHSGGEKTAALVAAHMALNLAHERVEALLGEVAADAR